jgi:hypothetical protein
MNAPVNPPINPVEQLQKLHKDLRAAAITLTETEARFLVDHYYIMQEDRKRAHNQVLALDADKEPHEIVGWLAGNSRVLENEIKKVLETYASSKRIGVWMQSIVGIGPVISAGMLAHIDIEMCRTVGQIWRFAGYDPTVKWAAKTKRPWNAGLKTLCWKTGQSFMKFSGNPDCVYGHMYKTRKAYEVARNDSGSNAERAARILTEKNFDKTTEAYKHLTAGHLPPAQIDAMARRWAVKMFLSHLHICWWYDTKGELPPVPYVIGIKGHIDFVPPPNQELIPGLAEALNNTINKGNNNS